MKIDHYNLILNHRIDGQWEWAAFLFFGPGIFAEAAIKSVAPHYLTEDRCRREAKKLLTELGIINMNRNTKRRKAENPGAHQPRKSTKPKVAASAAEITRRISKERS